MDNQSYNAIRGFLCVPLPGIIRYPHSPYYAIRRFSGGYATFEQAFSFFVNNIQSVPGTFQARSLRTIPTYVLIIWFTLFMLWVISTISSGGGFPSSFHWEYLHYRNIGRQLCRLCLAAASAYTTASISELEARRLPPCRPVQEHSPTAYRRSIEDCPFRSTRIPPQR